MLLTIGVGRFMSFQVLAHDIVKSGTLRVLRLGDNALGPSAGDAAAACMQLPSLEVLDLSGALLGPGSITRTRRAPNAHDVCCAPLRLGNRIP